MTRRSETASRPLRRKLIQFAVASCFATGVHANPTAPSVVSGAATFDAVGKSLTVTNTPGAIINWQGFSIRADEVTRFIQSGAASAVLNRVTGPDQSALLGQLLSNGRVFLINPNGVTVGAGALIDTAGFVASSLNLSNEDFLAGKFRFTDPGNAGKVANAGTINAGSSGAVYLVAPSVENDGVITAPGGDIILAAGKSVEIVSAANPDLRVQVQAGGDALNLGKLMAETGHVGIYGAAIRNSGTVSADSAQLTAAGTVMLKASRDVTLDATSSLTANGAQGGSITVQAEAGTLLADGRVESKGSQSGGGDVKLLGQQVGVVNQASVDASGRTGGGTVLVGGDYQGKNAEVQNARVTYVAPDARIAADAVDSGDGGKAIVWADGTTRFSGSISAQGGAAGGNGGFAEVSGKETLEYTGNTDLRANAGAAGTLLLDPKFILIQAGGPAPVATNNQFTENPTGTSVISGANLATAINAANVTLQANTDITVDDDVTATTANRSLTMQAGRSIVFNAGRTITLNDANFTATVNDAAAQAVNRDPGAAQFLMNAGSAIVTQGRGGGTRGNVNVNVGNFGGSSAGTSVTMLGGAAINTSGIANRPAGTVTINAASGTVDTSAGTITATGGANGAAAAGRAGGAVAMTGASVTTGTISTRGGDGLGANNVGGTGGAVTLTAGAVSGALQVDGAIDTRGGDSVGTGNTGAGGAVTLRTADHGTIASTAGGTITTTGGRGQTGGNFSVTSVTPASDTVASVTLVGAINVDGGVTALSGTLAGKNSGTVNIANATAVTVGPISARGSNAGGGNTNGGNGGAVSITARNGTPSVQLNGAVDTRGGDSAGTGNAGSGGAVALRATAGGAIAAAVAATIDTTGGRGQTGGAVTISGAAAADTLASVSLAGAITTDGGIAASSGTLGGKNAGAVGITNATAIAVGPISARGSNAGGGNTVGGNGGAVTINRRGPAAAVAVNNTIDTRGGDSAGTGNTGNGGAVVIDGGVAPDLGTLALATGANIDTRGGRGQNGGTVTIRDFTNIDTSGAAIDTSGGAAPTNSGATGAGKNAAAIAITGTGTVSVGALTARGSNAIAGSGKAGGAGAAVTVTGGGVALNGSLTSAGGSGDGAGAAGTSGAVTLNGGVLGGVTQVAASTVDAGSAAITVDGNDGAINLAGTLTTTSTSNTAVLVRDATTAALGNINAASGRVVLGQGGANNLSGAVTQNAGSSIVASSLSTVGGSAVTLTNANQVGTLIASTPAGGLTLNNGNNALTVAGNVTTTNGAVDIGTGTGTYTQNNNVDINAGSGNITVTADQVVLGTNGGNNALRTSGTLALKPASPGQPMRIGSAAGADTPGTFELRAAEITAFATGATGPIVIGDAAASTGTMTIAGPVNLAGKTVTLNAGSLSDSGIPAITAQDLNLNARTGTIGAPGTPIDVAVTNLTVNTVNQNAHVSEANAVNLGPGASNLGTGGLELVANGAITQTGAVTASGGSTLAAGAGNNITLTNAANDFGTVAVTNGNTVALNDVNALTLGASTLGTLTATAGGALSVSGVQNASGAGNSIVLSGTSFVNNVGAGALVVPGGGRWVVYSSDPAGNTFNSLASGNQAIWNATFAGNPPGTIPAGKRYVFSTQPTLTFTSTDATKIYGDAANVSGDYTVSGYINAATYGNVFTQDIAANTFTGTPTVTSAGAPPIANAGLYPITVTAGSLTTTTGYALAFDSAGQLTVNPRPITVQANDQGRAYGNANPATGPYTITTGTLAGADSITNVNVASPATVASGVGPYPLTPTAANFGTGTATNYMITFADGVLTVTPLPITVTANNQGKVYGQPDPTLTFTAPTVNGDVLNGIPVRAAGETVAGGPYAIMQGTVTNAANPNYNINFVNGQLVITPAPLTIAADDKARLAGQPNPPFTATATGFKLGQTFTDLNGSLTLITPATTTSPAGVYPIVPGGVSSTNYMIAFVDGILAVGQAAPPADRALISAIGRSMLLGSGAAQPGAATNVNPCQLPAPLPGQSGDLAASQRALNLAAAGRPLGAPDCEDAPQQRHTE